MTVINSNIPSLIAAQALKANSRTMAQAMERLSTGKRINSGADDPAGIGMAARLEAASRADRVGIRNANDGVAMLQTYAAAGQTILNVVLRMKELAMQSASDTLTADDKHALDNEYNQLGQEWSRIALNTSWNGQTGMATFNNSFNVRVSGGNAIAGIAAATVTFQMRSWNPTNSVTNNNVTNASVAAADDQNGAVTQAFNFTRNQNNNMPTPVANMRSFDHIQTRAAGASAVLKLDSAITGMSRALADSGAFINRLTIASDNLSAVATATEKSRSQIEDADYAHETTILARSQIIAQAATAMLAQANAAPQTVLALLQ